MELELASGTVLRQRYCIQKRIAEGGMARVYLASMPELGHKPVAVKGLSIDIPDSLERAAAIRQIRNEAAVLGRLDHPGLIQVFDCFEEFNTQFIVMEYVDGQTLDQAVNAMPDLPEIDSVVRWVGELCEVLEYLHSQSPPVLFRDMKPNNAMLDARGRVRVIDFGISRTLEGTNRTMTFLRGVGTVGFAPPEQYDGSGTDIRSDIYSLGATAYALLTRRVPPMSIVLLAGDDVLESPRLFNPHVTDGLEAWVLAMMALDRRHRYPSAAEAHRELKRLTGARTAMVAPGTRAAGVAPDGHAEGSTPIRSADVTPVARVTAEGSSAANPAGREEPHLGVRLVSILFLDIANYSTFRNEEQLRLRSSLVSLLDSIPFVRQLAPQDWYVDTRAGDAAVVMFYRHLAGPIESALYLAANVAKGLDPRLMLRMGLHVGTCQISVDGTPIGDALNMGQRVANAGQPGDITASLSFVEMVRSDSRRFDDLFCTPRVVEVKHGRQMTIVPVKPASPSTDSTLAVCASTRPAETQSGFRIAVITGSEAGRVIPLPARTMRLGRGEPQEAAEDWILMAEPSVSRQQAALSWDPERRRFTLIAEPRATNATLVQNAVIERRELEVGDLVRIGLMSFVVEREEDGTTGPAPAAAGSVGTPIPDPFFEPVSSPGGAVTAPPQRTAAAAPAPPGTSAWNVRILFVLRIVQGPARGRTFPMAEGLLVEGRRINVGQPGGRENEIDIADEAIAHAQAHLQCRQGRLYLVAESTRPPTLINGSLLQQPHRLEVGDRFSFGETLIVVQPAIDTTARYFLDPLDLPPGVLLGRHALPEGDVTVGRVPPCDLVIDDAAVSRCHAMILFDGQGYRVRNESRTNMTIVNGMPLTGERRLFHGDEIRLSDKTILRFVDVQQELF